MARPCEGGRGRVPGRTERRERARCAAAVHVACAHRLRRPARRVRPPGAHRMGRPARRATERHRPDRGRGIQADSRLHDAARRAARVGRSSRAARSARQRVALAHRREWLSGVDGRPRRRRRARRPHLPRARRPRLRPRPRHLRRLRIARRLRPPPGARRARCWSGGPGS